jgi:hypothetical protein
MVKWLALLLHIEKVMASELSQGTGCPDAQLLWFSYLLQANAGIVPQIRPQPYQFIIPSPPPPNNIGLLTLLQFKHLSVYLQLALSFWNLKLFVNVNGICLN